MEMKPQSDETESDQEHQSLSSPLTGSVDRQSGDSIIVNPASSDNDQGHIPGLPSNRDNYGVIGSSQEDIQRSLQCTQPPGQVSAPVGSTSTPPQQQNNTQMPGATSPCPVPSTSNNSVPLCSQHSNDSGATSVPDNSNSAPTATATRPQSLNSTPVQQNQATCTCFTAPAPVAQPPVRLNSTESTNLDTSEGRVPSSNTPAELTAPIPNSQSTENASLPSLLPLSAAQHTTGHDGASDGGLPSNRNHYRAVGSSQENVQRPWQCTQSPEQMSTTTPGCIFPPQQPSSAQTLSSGLVPSTSNSIMPLCSRQSDGSGVNSSTVPDNSISTPVPPPATYARSESLPVQHNQALMIAPTPDNTRYGVQPPVRLNSTESTNSDASHTSEGRAPNSNNPSDQSTLLFFPNHRNNTPSLYPLPVEHASNPQLQRLSSKDSGNSVASTPEGRTESGDQSASMLYF